jgi:hypothetical protein
MRFPKKDLGDIFRFNDHIAKARTRRNVKLQILISLFGFLGEKLFVGTDAGLALVMAALG